MSSVSGVGGGLFSDIGAVFITNTTIAANSAVSGGGLFSGRGQLELLNTILARNTSPSFGIDDCFGRVTSLGHNLIGNTTDCTISLQTSDLTGDPGLDAFTDDGTPGHGHFPLLATSRGINRGDAGACPLGTLDQLGHPRVGPCDIGAIESQIKEAPLADLQVWWKFDEGSGTTTHDSAQDYPGTLIGPDWVPGHTQPHALRFVKRNRDVVRNASFPWPAGSPITVLFWLYTEGQSGVGTMGVFQLGPGDNQVNGVGAHVPDSAGLLYWDYGPHAQGGRLSTPYKAYLGQWTRVALVASGTTGQFKGIYLNGQAQESSASSAAPTSDITGLAVGYHQPFSTQHYCNCLIEDFRIYNIPLSPAQILADYDGTPPPSAVGEAQATTRLGGDQ